MRRRARRCRVQCASPTLALRLVPYNSIPSLRRRGSRVGIAYRSSQAPRHDVAAWLERSTDALTLAPGESRVVTFTSVIPADAYAGTYRGDNAAANLTQQTSTGQGDIHIMIQHLTVIAVQIDATSITLQTPDYSSVDLGIVNSGTVLVKPRRQLQILDATNQVVCNVSFKLGQMLLQANVSIPVALGGDPFASGVYQAVVTLTYGQDPQQSVSRLKLSVGQAPISLPLPKRQAA